MAPDKSPRRKLFLGIGCGILGLCLCAYIGFFVPYKIAEPNPAVQATRTALAVAQATEARQETSTAQSRGRKATQWAGVYIGMPADDVLKIHPKKETESKPEVLGSDSEGLIVKWTYHGAYLIFALREGKGTDSLGFSKCYRVVEIYLR